MSHTVSGEDREAKELFTVSEEDTEGKESAESQ